jgi:hypothetical protein
VNPAIAAYLVGLMACLTERGETAGETERLRRELLAEAERHAAAQRVIARVDSIRTSAEIDQIRAELEVAMGRVR